MDLPWLTENDFTAKERQVHMKKKILLAAMAALLVASAAVTGFLVQRSLTRHSQHLEPVYGAVFVWEDAWDAV